MLDISKYAREFARCIRNFNYEKAGDRGIFFPKAQVFCHGEYVHDVNGMDERRDRNLIPDEGILHFLDITLNNGTKNAVWYLSLYAAAYTPLAGLTQASYPATAAEITSATEGYTEAVRQTWTPAAPSGNLIDNLASKAAFTIATASSLAVNGAALHSNSTKGGTTGTLVSAAKFSATRTLYDTDVFNLAYRLSLSSS